MAAPAAPATSATRESPTIPYRPAGQHEAGDLAVVLALTLLALVGLAVLARWLQRRGVLPGAPASPATSRVLESLRLGRGATLSIVQHGSSQLAVVDSPRGVALCVLPNETRQDG